MRLVLAAIGAEFLQIQPVGVISAVFLGDVITVLAHLAGQSDLGPYVGTGGHVGSLFRFFSLLSCSDGRTRTGDLTIMSRSL